MLGGKTMIIYNVKLNSNFLLKLFFGIAIIIAIIFFSVSAFKIFKASAMVTINDEIKQNGVYEITANNYTNVLKAVHDDVDTYVGQKIHCTGYVYRVYDIKNNQFIIARDMIISSNLETLVVGFLCESDEMENLQDKQWVEIEGTVIKGDYHGDIPVVKVEKIKKVEKPSEEYVYPPDSSYVPTAALVG